MEKPIAYSTDMVLATLDGRKSQTRRMVKMYRTDEHPLRQNASWLLENKTCPFGKPGDLLWVREEHLITFSEDKTWINVEFKDGYKFSVYFKEISLKLLKRLHKRKTIGKWQRARFLPKEFARLWLQVANVRVERLKDITQEDCLAEGIIDYGDGTYKNYFRKKGLRPQDGVECLLPMASFQSLICSIHGLEIWEQNPWVWVVEFEVLSTTGVKGIKEVNP